MTQEFRYSLTRICLRTGQLSLSQRMAEIFPDSGSLTALDTLADRELELRSLGPRRIAGMAEYFRRHRLEVNDSVSMRLLPDGRVALTANRRRSRRNYGDAVVVRELLDGLLDDQPRTEAEIRALHTDLPADFRLSESLERDGRFERRAGRWTAAPQVSQVATQAASQTPSQEAPQAAGPMPPQTDREEATPAGPDEPTSAGDSVRHAAVTPYPRGVMFPGEAALNSKRPALDLNAVNRAREALIGFGYRVEGLPHGMLLAKAELGRRKHAVLVRVLGDGERLDWAALLARRREQSAENLAVFGDHRDLHRLTAPAELARATLWSWVGISRVQSLAENILIGPFDLEPHFEKGGMFGAGLQRFESTINRMIAERGVLSAVLSRLAGLRAPSVFVLDDLLEADFSREEAATALELLGRAPFHLVAKVDKGEYCLRHRVSDGLLQVSEYALSLRERLPLDRGERLEVGPEANGGATTAPSPIKGRASNAWDGVRSKATEDTPG